MTDTVSTQHQPAFKVGGRRRSISTKHKQRHSEERSSAEVEETKLEFRDYPRPAPPDGEIQALHEHSHNNYEEEVPHRKEKKNAEGKIQEYAYWKSETTRPTRDLSTGLKGQNSRILQPVGKGLNI